MALPLLMEGPMRVLVSTFVGLAALFPAAAGADPWCTLWKNQQICGSVEYFQMLAKRTCLQAQAKEGATVDESIVLHGDCQAAKETVNKIELVVSAHERAVAAQKELDAMPR
jgi:hypothetical protein